MPGIFPTSQEGPSQAQHSPSRAVGQALLRPLGAHPDRKHILVVEDALTRCPKAVVVHCTGVEDNIHAFSEIFSRHRFPRVIHSDNGPSFNGSDSNILSMVEAFMKIFYTAEVAHKYPYLRLNDYLLLHSAMPHPTTKNSPAELLFNRKFVTILPDIRHNPAAGRQDILEFQG